PLSKMSMHDDVFDDINGDIWNSDGKPFQFVDGSVNQANTLNINHTTTVPMAPTGSPVLIFSATSGVGKTSSNFVFTNNIVQHGSGGIKGDNVEEGSPTIAA